jgi:hypothetical protein
MGELQSHAQMAACDMSAYLFPVELALSDACMLTAVPPLV